MRLQRAVDQFLSGYFATHERSLKTSLAYATDLKQLLAFLKFRGTLRSLTPDVVEGWAGELRAKGYQPTSIRRKLAALRALCNYWVRRNALAASPFWRLRLNLGSSRVLPRVLSADEMAALLREAARRARAHPAAARRGLGPGFLAVRDLAIVELLFATGVRVGEMVGIQLDDLSLEERSILIRGKGRRQRLAFLIEPRSFRAVQSYVKLRTALPARAAPMPARAAPMAARAAPIPARAVPIPAHEAPTLAPALPDPTAALFVNRAGRPLSTQGAATVLRGLAQAAGIPRRITPHMLRHTVATLLLRNGADLRVVQEFLGHASIVMTQRYTQVAKEQLIRTLKDHHPRAAFGGV